MKEKIEQGFILAAGFGKRMRPLTDAIPKPMVCIKGKPMIDHIINEYKGHGLKTIIINTHYLSDVLENHVQQKHNDALKISHEAVILDTGGGIKNALPLLDSNKAFFVASGDSYLEKNDQNSALTQLENFWNPEIMDILILLQPVSSMTQTKGIGDYDLDLKGKATRSLNQSGKYMFTSLRINKASIFDDEPRKSFSYLDLLDKAQTKGRLYGIIHQGMWHHISTPDDVKAVNTSVEKSRHAI